MIGGNDILIPTAPGPAAMDFVIRAIRRQWRSAVFEDARTGEFFHEFRRVGLNNRSEILAYRDRPSADKWHQLGADDSLTGTMIHLLMGEAGLTAVVDVACSQEIESLIESIRKGLRQDLFGIKAETRSAA